MHTPGSVARALVYALVMADASTSLPESTPASPVPDSVSEASPSTDDKNDPTPAADVPDAYERLIMDVIPPIPVLIIPVNMYPYLFMEIR